MSKGFTFIELVVATGIMLALVGFGSASYVNFNERQILEQAAKDFKNNLKVAQQNAITGVKDNELCDPDFNPATGTNGPTPPETFRGWCISPRHNNDPFPTPGSSFNSYQIYGVCDNEEDGINPLVFPQSGNIPVLELPDGVELLTRAFGPSIPAPGYEENTLNTRTRFNVFGEDVQFADNSYTKVVYCLQGNFPSLGAEDIYQITIQPSGEINDDGFVDDCTTI